MRSSSPLRALVAGIAVTVGALLAVAPATDAAAATPSQSGTTQSAGATQSTAPQTTTAMTPRQRAAERAQHVMEVVRSRRGDPYQYGAAGPSRFDCSGLVYWTFRRALGRTLPRTAEEQRRAATPVRRRGYLRRGDLVFETDSSGYAFHVGIYAGNGYFWNAPHSGSHVRREKMWSARWRFGRIIHSQ
jgi:cell wall-associated NlpC family hydrolase